MMDKPQQRQLTELTPAQLAEILRAGQRTTQSRILTKAFLGQVASQLQERVEGLDADVGVRTKSDERSQGIQFIDRAFFYLTRDLVDDAGKTQSLQVVVLLLPGQIWWGLHAAGSQSFATAVHEAFQRLDLIEPDDQVQVVSGALGAQKAWPSGGTFAIGRDLTADQVAALPDLGSLAATIVSDLVDLCLRVSPRVADLRQELIDPTSDADRASLEHARQTIELLLPDPDVRKVCLGLLGDAIVKAHQMRPAGWSVSLFPNLVRLNVGRIRAHDISANQVHLVLATDALDKQAEAALQEHAETWPDGYASLPGTTDARFAAGELSNLLPFIRDAHLGIVAQAAQVLQNRTSYYKSHAPGVLAYLRSFLGRELPDPIYAPPPPPVPVRPVDIATLITTQVTQEGLHFTSWQLATFYTALQTKGFVILSGISGTGKTKLAQTFATVLPQPTSVEITAPDEVISLTIQPYMVKYGRFIVPQRIGRLFEPPAPGATQEIRLTFNAQSQNCRLVHASYSNADYLSVLLRGAARQWFTRNLAVGDVLILEPEVDLDQLVGFRLFTSNDVNLKPQQVKKVPNWLFVPVRPDWRDSKSLLGYYNPLTGTYEWTPFLRFLLRAEQNYKSTNKLAWFVILDEMNLAHVEYYFADLLSVLESGRDEDGWTREPLRLGYPDEAEGDLPPRELKLPPNLYIVGTVNVDETTHAFSAKVLDRAFTLELTDADFSTYLSATAPGQTNLSDEDRQAILRNFMRNGAFARIDKSAIAAHLAAHPQVRYRLQTLNALLRPHDLHFGYRVFDEIVAFLAIAQDNKLYGDLNGEVAAFDAAVLMKVLPKFHGSRSRLEAPLCTVLAWCVNPETPDVQAIKVALQEVGGDKTVEEVMSPIPFRYPRTAERVQRMVSRLHADGFAAFG